MILTGSVQVWPGAFVVPAAVLLRLGERNVLATVAREAPLDAGCHGEDELTCRTRSYAPCAVRTGPAVASVIGIRHSAQAAGGAPEPRGCLPSLHRLSLARCAAPVASCTFAAVVWILVVK